MSYIQFFFLLSTPSFPLHTYSLPHSFPFFASSHLSCSLSSLFFSSSFTPSVLSLSFYYPSSPPRHYHFTLLSLTRSPLTLYFPSPPLHRRHLTLTLSSFLSLFSPRRWRRHTITTTNPFFSFNLYLLPPSLHIAGISHLSLSVSQHHHITTIF